MFSNDVTKLYGFDDHFIFFMRKNFNFFPRISVFDRKLFLSNHHIYLYHIIRIKLDSPLPLLLSMKINNTKESCNSVFMAYFIP